MLPNKALLAALILLAFIAPARADTPAEGDAIRYTVRAGDTLFDLAAKYMTGRGTVVEVQRRNRVREPRRLAVGSSLTIPRRLLRSIPIELRVHAFSGPVAILDSAAHRVPTVGMTLAEGREVETGPNGFVTLAGADGSRFTLPSNSRVRINRARRYLIDSAPEIDFEVRQGRTEVKAAPQPAGGRFRVRTPIAVSAVRGTSYRVGFSAAGETSLTEVLEGSVAVANDRAEGLVPAGSGAAVRSGSEIVSETLLAAPTVIAPGRIQTEAKVAFAARPLEGARAYRFEIGRDAGFLEVLAESEIPAPLAEFSDIANGTFFVRASGVAASGLAGRSEVNSFRRQRVGLQADAGQSDIPGAFRFGWLAEGDGASLYRFQLLGAPGQDAPLVDEAGLSETGLTLTGLKPGAYRWRVGVLQVTAAGSAEVWSPLQALTIN